MISLEDIRRIGREKRNNAHRVACNCDYISKEFRKEIVRNNENININDIILPVVHITDNKGREYNDGHTIIKINSDIISDYNKTAFLYVDLTLDQFCEENYQDNDLISISFGPKDSIENVKIMNETEVNRKYIFTNMQL